MAYEFERSEWRRALRTLTEHGRVAAVDDTRRAIGITGDRDDARADMPQPDDSEGE